MKPTQTLDYVPRFLFGEAAKTQLISTQLMMLSLEVELTSMYKLLLKLMQAIAEESKMHEGNERHCGVAHIVDGILHNNIQSKG